MYSVLFHNIKNSAMTVTVYFSWCAWVSVSQCLNLWVELLDHSKFIFSIYSIIPNCLLRWLYQFILTQQNMSISVVSHSHYNLVLANLNILDKRTVSLDTIGFMKKDEPPFYIWISCDVPIKAFTHFFTWLSGLFLLIFKSSLYFLVISLLINIVCWELCFLPCVFDN